MSPSDRTKRLPLPSAAEFRQADAHLRVIERLLGGGESADREAASRGDLEEALGRERSLLRTIIDSLPAMIYAKDEQSRFIACNDFVARYMGTTPAEAIGKTDFDFFPREMAERFFADEQSLIRSGEALIEREELVLDRSTGVVRYFSTTKVPFRDDTGKLIGIVGIGRDITDRKQADERIRYLATHDCLTDLPNRAAFSGGLGAAIIEASAQGARLGILFVDLDHFKLTNDSLGHEAGDELLRQTAARLRGCVRAGDVVARLGGDEFVVLYKDPSDLNDIDALASRVLRAVSRPVVLLGERRRVSASVGVAVFPHHGDTERALMKSADVAMYAAKQAGRSAYRLYSNALLAASADRMPEALPRFESPDPIF